MDADEATPNRTHEFMTGKWMQTKPHQTEQMNWWLSNGCRRSHTKQNKWIHDCQMDADEATPNRTNEFMTVIWMHTKPHQTEQMNWWLSNGCTRSHTKQKKWIHDCQMVFLLWLYTVVTLDFYICFYIKWLCQIKSNTHLSASKQYTSNRKFSTGLRIDSWTNLLIFFNDDVQGGDKNINSK